jgi:hypothetical protein
MATKKSRIVHVDFATARHERDVEIVCAVVDRLPLEEQRAFRRLLHDLTDPIKKVTDDLAACIADTKRKLDERDARRAPKPAKPAKKRR